MDHAPDLPLELRRLLCQFPHVQDFPLLFRERLPERLPRRRLPPPQGRLLQQRAMGVDEPARLLPRGKGAGEPRGAEEHWEHG